MTDTINLLPDFLPPPRFSDSSFESYRAQNDGQELACEEARAFVSFIHSSRSFSERLRRWIKRDEDPDWKGLYMVGPVGTGKTHLLASMYFSLHPAIPCAFIQARALYRIPIHPEELAATMTSKYRVLCLDEVEIDDPANEARLVVFLKTLQKKGTFLLATSNVEPERFLSAEYGNDRFRRFLSEEFRNHHKVVIVGGDDYRRLLHKPGQAWIGERNLTRSQMQRVFDRDRSNKIWVDFDELMHQSAHIEHTRLVRRYCRYECLYLADIRIDGADQAMRFLWIIDDLYMAPDAPILYYTSEKPIEQWLAGANLTSRLEKGIAEKFNRTTSRLQAMCRVEEVNASVQ